MCSHSVCSRYTLYRFICPLVVYSCTVSKEVVKPLIPRKYAVLKGNFVLDLFYIFQECKPDVKRDLPEQTNNSPDIIINNVGLRAKYLLYYCL